MHPNGHKQKAQPPWQFHQAPHSQATFFETRQWHRGADSLRHTHHISSGHAHFIKQLASIRVARRAKRGVHPDQGSKDVKMRMVAKANGLRVKLPSSDGFEGERDGVSVGSQASKLDVIVKKDRRFEVRRRARESVGDGVVEIDIGGVGNGGEDRISIGREAKRRASVNESAKEEVVCIEGSEKHEGMCLVDVFEIRGMGEYGIQNG
ncbi:unnamed protein product [Dovyalis caffra]|uniref:Uncharacterized protein n=1 Tax=Dovyalis caffra TaxID=77055 RepID=A0AAV1RH38_9ROSI|nr:unnamed protein product [Dovyalis caffra]